MSEATQTPEERAPRKRATSLSTMLLADLKALAGGLGIADAGSMKKAQLVTAIKQYQDAHSQAPRSQGEKSASAPSEKKRVEPKSADSAEPAATPREDAAGPSEKPVVITRSRGRARTTRGAAAEQDGGVADRTAQDTQADAPRQQRADAAVDQTGGGERAERSSERAERSSQDTQRSFDDTERSSEGAERSSEGAERSSEGAERSSEGAERRGRNRNRNRDRQNTDSQGDGQAPRTENKQSDKQSDKQGDGQRNDGQKNARQGEAKDGQKGDGAKGDGSKKSGQQGGGGNQGNAQGGNAQSAHQNHPADDDYDDEGGSRRNRRRRGRDRIVERGGRNEPDTTILDDDVLVPAAGILDVLDNYAFVRTAGYLPGPDDVYLSLSMVRKYGLRRGDAVVGQVRQPREGERREKFNPMVRIDQVNGLDPEVGKERPEFDAFVPVHPNSRLRLETGPDNLLGRIVDVLAPIGKGQRGMVLSPPRSGKTQVLQTIAAAIRHNNPECHVMVVLIDERPEEVTDYQRTVRGEVVASTFDRPAADHVLLAELAVERAKRLVEMGHDVVVLLDSLTRLARAFNVTAPGSGRQGAGGVDPVALHPAKRLFGAARNVEDGGSLTILATALVDSGSPLDEAVLDEFNDTANMELRLRRELVERRIFPPVDVVVSGTRREEHLLSTEEQQVTFKLRSALTDLAPRDALERVVARMRNTNTNVEFLTQVQKASPDELSGK